MSPWVYLAIVVVGACMVRALQAAVQNHREAVQARAEARLWQIAVVETLAQWVQTEHGEAGARRWRQFARYTPPEVVRESLPLPRSVNA